MSGQFVDIALLVMLVLFFGRQQSLRPESYYRLWFVGWLFVLSGYAVERLPVGRPFTLRMHEAIRIDLVLIGTLIFLVSFVWTEKGLGKVIVRGMMVGVPVVLCFNAVDFVPVPRWVLMVAVVAWEACGLQVANVLIPKGRVKTRAGIFAICVSFCVGTIVYLGLTGGHDIFELALAEVLISTAVMYGGGLLRRSFATYIGMAGFALWGSFYVAADFFAHGWPRALSALLMVWTVPKYFVGFSMVMKTFEDSAQEEAKLAEAYRALYDDFRMMYEEHPHPMWIRDIETGMFVSANRATLETYGYAMKELLTMRESDLVSPPERDMSETESLIPAALEGTRVRHRQKGGRQMWINLVERGIMFQGTPARLIMARDITERVKASEELARRANYDALTGLANRALLDDRIQQTFKRCERDGRKATLMTVDVDHFKQINDTYGHPVGDECLQIVAARLATKIRRVDTIARVGGEEFAAIIGGLRSSEDAGKVAESLLRVFEEPMKINDRDLYITVSVGIALYPDDATDVETLKRRSDEALYAAKRMGRNRAVFAADTVSPVAAVNSAAPSRREFDVTIVTDETLGV